MTPRSRAPGERGALPVLQENSLKLSGTCQKLICSPTDLHGVAHDVSETLENKADLKHHEHSLLEVSLTFQIGCVSYVSEMFSLRGRHHVTVLGNTIVLRHFQKIMNRHRNIITLNSFRQPV